MAQDVLRADWTAPGHGQEFSLSEKELGSGQYADVFLGKEVRSEESIAIKRYSFFERDAFALTLTHIF